MKRLLMLLVPALFVLSSCSNDEENEGVDSQQASAHINSVTSQASGDVTDLVDAESVQSLVHLLSLVDGSTVINGRTDQRQWTKERLQIIYQYFVKGPAARVDAEPSGYEDIKGLYEWNFETQDFDKSASEFFIVRFPTEGSATNNAEFKISSFEVVTITEDHGDFVDVYDVPSLLEAYLMVDEVTIASLSLDVDWSANGFPEKAEVTLFLAPFEFMLGLDATFPTNSSIIVSTKKNDEVIVAIDLDVAFESTAKEDPITFEGFVQYRALKIEGNVDITGIDEDGDPNDYIHLALYSDSDKLGDIVFELEEIEPGYDDYVVYVQYADGSRENLEDILLPVFEEIESLLEDL